MIIDRKTFAAVVLLMVSASMISNAEQSEMTVEIKGFSFQPDSITVPNASTVRWVNLDPVTHTVTSDEKSFDSNEIPASGGEFNHTFSAPGTYGYHCTIHPSMKGEIIVTQNEALRAMSSTRPRVRLEKVAEGFTAPMEFISSGDGTGRMFLVDQIGLVTIVEANGTVQARPFIDVRDRMEKLSQGYDERGLLGLAFHPNYEKNGRIFIFYSTPLRSQAPSGWNCTNLLSEFSVSDDPNLVDMKSEKVILYVDKPQSNHNGGTIAFGPDGYLYVPLGDGGGADDKGLGHAPGGNGQSTDTMLGKILRIDVDSASNKKAYAIPPDNPFVGQEGILPEIFALGLRNPWRISFDSAGNHSLLVSDAGQNLWEEVDLVTRGGNYGWNIREGTHCFDPQNPGSSPATCANMGARGEQLIEPVIEYGHDLGSVVVGGYVYRGQSMPEMTGKYIFADWSKGFASGNGTLLVATPTDQGLWKWEEVEIAGLPGGRINQFIRSFGIDDKGELYVLTSEKAGPNAFTGKVFRLMPA